MIKSVSLIIPFKSDKSEKEKLFTLLRGISNWKAVPNEIIIIKKSKPKNIFSFIAKIKKTNIINCPKGVSM